MLTDASALTPQDYYTVCLPWTLWLNVDASFSEDDAWEVVSSMSGKTHFWIFEGRSYNERQLMLYCELSDDVMLAKLAWPGIDCEQNDQQYTTIFSYGEWVAYDEEDCPRPEFEGNHRRRSDSPLNNKAWEAHIVNVLNWLHRRNGKRELRFVGIWFSNEKLAAKRLARKKVVEIDETPDHFIITPGPNFRC